MTGATEQHRLGTNGAPRGLAVLLGSPPDFRSGGTDIECRRRPSEHGFRTA